MDTHEVSFAPFSLVMSMQSRIRFSLRFFPIALLLLLASFLLPSCLLFDDTKINQQRAELERLRAESERLRQSAETLRQQTQKEDQEREACNQAFYAFDAGRKAGDTEEAIAKYKEGLGLCPTDDVAHNELGEIYMRLGRKRDAVEEFQAALRVNPDFSRAQRNLDSIQ